MKSIQSLRHKFASKPTPSPGEERMKRRDEHAKLLGVPELKKLRNHIQSQRRSKDATK